MLYYMHLAMSAAASIAWVPARRTLIRIRKQYFIYMEGTVAKIGSPMFFPVVVL